jgi:hypothetical protein
LAPAATGTDQDRPRPKAAIANVTLRAGPCRPRSRSRHERDQLIKTPAELPPGTGGFVQQFDVRSSCETRTYSRAPRVQEAHASLGATATIGFGAAGFLREWRLGERDRRRAKRGRTSRSLGSQHVDARYPGCPFATEYSPPCVRRFRPRNRLCRRSARGPRARAHLAGCKACLRHRGSAHRLARGSRPRNEDARRLDQGLHFTLQCRNADERRLSDQRTGYSDVASVPARRARNDEAHCRAGVLGRSGRLRHAHRRGRRGPVARGRRYRSRHRGRRCGGAPRLSLCSARRRELLRLRRIDRKRRRAAVRRALRLDPGGRRARAHHRGRSMACIFAGHTGDTNVFVLWWGTRARVGVHPSSPTSCHRPHTR